jgi:hypothetical protein
VRSGLGEEGGTLLIANAVANQEGSHVHTGPGVRVVVKDGDTGGFQAPRLTRRFDGSSVVVPGYGVWPPAGEWGEAAGASPGKDFFWYLSGRFIGGGHGRFLDEVTATLRDSKPGLAAPGWIEGYIGITVSPVE